MRKGWTEITLSDVLSRSIGGVWGAESGSDQEEVMVVRSTEFTKSGILNYSTGVPRSITSGQLASRQLAAGDILLEKSGGGPEQPVGRVVFVKGDIPPRFVCSNFIQLLTPIVEKVVPQFLFLMMWMWHFENRTLEYQAQTTGIRNLRTPDYLEQIISLPSLAEQKRIVDVVSSVDAYIDALHQQADTARTARNAVLHGLLEVVADSPIKKLKDLTSKIGSGATPRGGESVYQKSGVTLIRSQNVHNALFLHDGLVAIDDSAAAALDGVSVEVNDVLINITGASVARTCLVDETVLPARVNQHVAILRTDSKVLLPGFLLRVLLGQKMNSYLLDISGSGTTRQAITKAQLESLEMAVPPISEQERIVEIVSSMDGVIQSTEQAVIDAKALRSGLLSDLLSGDHEIPASYDSLLGAA
jgi:restriction endonuclease S subunit